MHKQLHSSYCTHFDAIWWILTHSEHSEQDVENSFFLLKPDLFFPKCSEFIGMNFLYAQLSKKLILLNLNKLKCIKMHQNVSKCIKMYADGIIIMFWAWNFNLKNLIFLVKNCQFFFSKCSKCINMHRNASKCMQNELCKCFVHKFIKKVVFITLN